MNEHNELGIGRLGLEAVMKDNVKVRATFTNLETEILCILDRVSVSVSRIAELNEYIDPRPLSDSGEAIGQDLGLLNRLNGYCKKTMGALCVLEDEISRLEATIGKKEASLGRETK